MAEEAVGPAALGAGTRINRWWSADSTEIFWLEVGARGEDLGVDLNAPIANERGSPFWSYDLIKEVDEGDVVLHYDRDEHAIVAWSVAVGSAWRDTVVWAARGTFARGQNIQPHERPGRRLSLHGPVFLARPLSLERIREMRMQLEQMRVSRPYFPFELGSRPARPVQGYLFKLPAAFVGLFPELEEVPRRRAETGDRLPSPRRRVERARRGERDDFIPRNEEVRSREARPWVRDPSEIDRALSSHARIERIVAEAAQGEGWKARRMGPGDPPFDLLLVRPSANLEVVVEAKSTTAVNEEKQLRLALGQVLRYRQVLRTAGGRVEGMIAVEEEPEAAWSMLCNELDVLLVWPASVRRALERLA